VRNVTRWKLTCACGWETDGAEEAVVAETQAHGRQLHNMDVTAEQARAMATRVDD